MPRYPVVLCVVLCVTSTFAASKKSEQHPNWSQEQAELSLWNGDWSDLGISVSGGVGDLRLSQGGGDSGGPLILSPDNWNGGTGNWSNAGDWSAGEPGAGSDVTIYSGGNDTVTLDVSTTISSLTLGGAFNGTASELTDGGVAQTLTITNALNVGSTGFLYLTGGSIVTAGAASSSAATIELFNKSSLSINGGFTNSGFADFESGSTLTVNFGDVTISGAGLLGTDLTNFGGGNTINIGGNLNNSGTSSAFDIMGAGDSVSIGGTFGNSGGVAISGAGAMVTAGGLNNAATGQIVISGGSTLQIESDATNAGIIDASGGGNTINVLGMLTNSGTFELMGKGDQSTIGNGLSNSGMVEVFNGSALSITAGGVTNSAGASIDVEGGSTLSITGDVTNSGFMQTDAGGLGAGNTLSISGMLTNPAGGLFELNGHGDMGTIGNGLSNAGTVDVDGGSTLTITGDVTNTGILATFFNGLAGGNTLNITGNLNNSNTLELLGAGDMATIGNGLTNTDMVDVFNGGTLTVTAGGLTNSGMVDVEQGSTLNITGDVINSGTMGTDLNGMGGGNTINIGGMLTNNGNFELTGASDQANVTGNTNNSGLIQLSGAGSKATLAGLTNSGDVEVGKGSTLQINGDVTNSFIIETGATVSGGGNTVNITGTLTNTGPDGFGLFGVGDTATIGGDLNNSAIVTVENGSSLTVDGNVNNSGTLATTFFRNGGGNTLTVQGTVTNSGTFELVGPNDMATLGGLTNSVGGLVDLENGSTLVVDGNVDNAWEMFTSSMNGSGGNTIAINGKLTNESTGQVILYGSHDVAELVSLDNSGLVDFEGGPGSGMLVFKNVNNSGSILTGFITGTGGNTIEILGSLNNNGGVGLFGAGDLAEIGGNLTNTTGAMIDVENGSTLIVAGDATSDGTIATNFSGLGVGGNSILVEGMLTNTANGVITLNGPADLLQALAGLSNSGVINVNNGSSVLPPFFNNLGTLNIDSTSRFVVGTPNPMGGQGYIQLANGTLGEMIASLNSFGVINVNGSALLDGTLAILLQGGYNPSVGSTFKFVDFTPGMLSGVFANIENGTFNGGMEKWVVDYDNADGFVELIAEPNQVPEPATLLVLIPGLVGIGYGLRRKLIR
jgi:hypothetical protein